MGFSGKIRSSSKIEVIKSGVHAVADEMTEARALVEELEEHARRGFRLRFQGQMFDAPHSRRARR